MGEIGIELVFKVIKLIDIIKGVEVEKRNISRIEFWGILKFRS